MWELLGQGPQPALSHHGRARLLPSWFPSFPAPSPPLISQCLGMHCHNRFWHQVWQQNSGKTRCRAQRSECPAPARSKTDGWPFAPESLSRRQPVGHGVCCCAPPSGRVTLLVLPLGSLGLKQGHWTRVPTLGPTPQLTCDESKNVSFSRTWCPLW